MRSTFYLFIALALLSSCSTSTKQPIAPDTNQPKVSLIRIIEGLVTNFYAYGFSAINYKNTNNAWPSSEEDLLSYTNTLFSEADLSKISLVSATPIDDSTYIIVSKFIPNADPSSKMPTEVELTVHNNPDSMSIKIKKHNDTRKTQDIIIGVMLAIAFKSKFGDNTHISTGINPTYNTSEEHEKQKQEKMKLIKKILINKINRQKQEKKIPNKSHSQTDANNAPPRQLSR